MGSPHSIVNNMLDCDIVVSKFKLQLCQYIHFQTNTLGKGMNLSYPSSYELNSATTVFYKDGGVVPMT